MHDYLSTACLHEQMTRGTRLSEDEQWYRDQCRYHCKFCPARCGCPCHDGTAEPFPGYDAQAEDRLRRELRTALADAGIAPGARSAELLVDIVTSVLHRIDAEEAGRG